MRLAHWENFQTAPRNRGIPVDLSENYVGPDALVRELRLIRTVELPRAGSAPLTTRDKSSPATKLPALLSQPLLHPRDGARRERSQWNRLPRKERTHDSGLRSRRTHSREPARGPCRPIRSVSPVQ